LKTWPLGINGLVEKTYTDMLATYGETLEKASEDVNKSLPERYMTSCKKIVVNIDKFKNDFVKNMGLSQVPMSCDALCMVSPDEFFLIEFKNGVIEDLRNYEIKVKIFETLLILTERLGKTIQFTRNHVTFILVYNEDVSQKFYIHKRTFDHTTDFKVEMGLGRFEKIYFKSVNVYSKAEFETHFVSHYCL
jgi:hypothetical protein